MSSVLLDPMVQAERDLQPGKPPRLQSYDSGEEFSFAHLVRVHELVELDDAVPDRWLSDEKYMHVG